MGKTPETVKEEVPDYLNGLYDDAFRVVSVEAASWAYSYDLLMVASGRYGGRHR